MTFEAGSREEVLVLSAFIVKVNELSASSVEATGGPTPPDGLLFCKNEDDEVALRGSDDIPDTEANDGGSDVVVKEVCRMEEVAASDEAAIEVVSDGASSLVLGVSTEDEDEVPGSSSSLDDETWN